MNHKKTMETLSLERRSDRYVQTYTKCLNSLLKQPVQNLHELPYQRETIDAMYQAAKDAAWLLKTKTRKKKNDEKSKRSN